MQRRSRVVARVHVAAGAVVLEHEHEQRQLISGQSREMERGAAALVALVEEGHVYEGRVPSPFAQQASKPARIPRRA
jgi:hypothetical protein